MGLSPTAGMPGQHQPFNPSNPYASTGGPPVPFPAGMGPGSGGVYGVPQGQGQGAFNPANPYAATGGPPVPFPAGMGPGSGGVYGTPQGGSMFGPPGGGMFGGARGMPSFMPPPPPNPGALGGGMVGGGPGAPTPGITDPMHAAYHAMNLASGGRMPDWRTLSPQQQQQFAQMQGQVVGGNPTAGPGGQLLQRGGMSL